MKLSTYLMFEGNCREAFTHYHKVLGGTIQAMMDHKGTPAEEHVPTEWRDKILHACLEIEGQLLMASDAPPNNSDGPMRSVSVSIGVATPEEDPWWWDVLRLGRESEHATAFDVDWAAGDGRIIIPVIGDDDEDAVLV